MQCVKKVEGGVILEIVVKLPKPFFDCERLMKQLFVVVSKAITFCKGTILVLALTLLFLMHHWNKNATNYKPHLKGRNNHTWPK